jgi:hypothetical protein
MENLITGGHVATHDDALGGCPGDPVAMLK